MKLAILSDFHLGYERFYDDAYLQAKEAIRIAAEKADVLIIPGDIFDNRAPKPEVFAQGINLFRSISGKKWRARVVEYLGKKKIYTDIPIIAIPGTHERRAHDSTDAVELLSLTGLLVNASEARVLIEDGDEKIAVFGLGGISDERVKETLKLLNPQPVEGAFNVFMLHQSIYEQLPFSKDFIHLDDLPKAFDLYINGHIHNKIEEKLFGKPFLIPGSTVLTQLKEGEQESKGIFIFDTNTKSYTFEKIKSRKFVMLKVNITGKEPAEIKETIKNKIEEIIVSNEKPVIRVMLEGQISKGLKHADIEIQDIPKAFQERATVEITKSKIDDKEAQGDIDSIRKGVMDNISIKDFGMSIFISKLKEQGYDITVNPAALFDILSSNESKEKTLKKAMDFVLQNKTL